MQNAKNLQLSYTLKFKYRFYCGKSLSLSLSLSPKFKLVGWFSALCHDGSLCAAVVFWLGVVVVVGFAVSCF